MIIIAAGDGHVTDERPVNRKDNYWQTCLRKLSFISELADQTNASVVVYPGDLTDTPALSYSEFSMLHTMLKEQYQNKTLVTIRGQHDLRYRRPENTALEALATSLASDSQDFVLLNQGETLKINGYSNVVFQGSNYGQSIPKPVFGAFNILVVHRMIIEEKLWAQQEEFEPSNLFLRQNKFDLIIAGDNHHGFIAEAAGSKRILANCGAMMRNSISLVDYRPFVVVFDTDTKEYEKVYIPIEPPEKVFRLDKIEAENERNESLDSFVTGLVQSKEVGLHFEENLQSHIKENHIDEDVTQEIYESFR